MNLASLSRPIDVATSIFASSARGWRGSASFRPHTTQPDEPLQLYEFEASPYCRLVREALTELDLDALILPCPRGGTRFRPELRGRGGKEQFPYLVDPNAGVEMYESAEIIDYLAHTYGGRDRTASHGLRRKLDVGSAFAAALWRSNLQGPRGFKARPSRRPEQPLELFSFESSPFSRLVREVLSEMELPYLLRNTAKARWEDMGPPWIRARFFPDVPVEGRNRLRLLDIAGKIQVPYLIDPNTGISMFESADIIDYLEREYAA